VIADQLPILQVVIPLVAAPICVLVGNRHIVYWLALLVSWLTFSISVGLMGQVLEGGAISYEIGNWKPPYGIEYVVDELSAFVMLFVSGMAAVALTYAPPSVNAEIHPSKHYLFYACYLMCLTGLLGICVTGDLFNVFVFLEVSSLSAYALISLGKTRRAPLAALQYLILGTIGATFFLIGVGLVYQMTGTLNMADLVCRIHLVEGKRTILVAIAFMTIGLSIKMAVFPVHAWLPNAYSYAPSVVTIFLAATATKVSIYVLIRLIYDIFTPKFTFDFLPLGNELRVLALVGIFTASIAAIYQTDVKRLLAYSSVAQIGYMLLGVSMDNQPGVTAGIVHMFNHALIKGGLFMVVGCFALRLGSVQLDDWRGAAKKMPLTSMAWVIGGLGLIGMPLTAGFVSKWSLLTATVDAEYWGVAGLMLLSSLLALVYVWRVVEVLYFSEPSDAVKALPPQKWEVPPVMLLMTYVVIGATLVFGSWTEFSLGIADLAAAALLGGGR